MKAGIKVEGVCKTFVSKDRTVSPLREMSFDINPGEICSVIGKSGCGKTTLLNLIASFIKQDKGQISFFDEQGHEIGEPVLSVVFQDSRLLPWKTVKENLSLPIRHLSQKDQEELIEEALELVRLPDIKNLYPRELSGGMAQRVGLARGFIGKPDVMLMDEPFSSLDAITRTQLQADFARISRELNTTIFLITHDIGEAVYLSNEILFMKEGKVGRRFEVDLPFPRNLGDPKLAEIQQELFRFLVDEKE